MVCSAPSPSVFGVFIRQFSDKGRAMNLGLIGISGPLRFLSPPAFLGFLEFLGPVDFLDIIRFLGFLGSPEPLEAIGFRERLSSYGK